MKKRRISLKTRQEKIQQKRQRRKYPFNETTMIRELFDNKSYGALRNMIDELRPYLLDQNADIYSATRLFFDLEKLKGYHSVVYIELAKLFKEVTDAGHLKCRKSIFFRFFSSPDHCNLDIGEKSLKTLIQRALQDID